MSDFERAGEELAPGQEMAVTALLTCRTLEEAAKKAKVSPATLRRWRSEPAFVVALRAARTAMNEGTTNALRGATLKAVQTLQRNLTCGTPSAENRAAEIILNGALKAIELEDLSERIAALEERNAGK